MSYFSRDFRGRAARLRAAVPVVALVALALLAGGCTVKEGFDFESDGSGQVTSIVAVDQQMLSQLNSSGSGSVGDASAPSGTPTPAPDPFADAKAGKGLPPGATVTDYTDPQTGRQGVQVVIPFANTDDLNALVKSSNDDGSSDDQVQVTRAGSRFTFRLVPKPSTPGTEPNDASPGATAGSASASSSSSAGSSTDSSGSSDLSFLLALFDLEYRIAGPGTLVDWGPRDNATQAQRPDGKWEISWKVSVASPTPSPATSASNGSGLFVVWDAPGQTSP